MVSQGQTYHNGKRYGFLPFLDLPRHTTKPLELAVHLEGYEDRAGEACRSGAGARTRRSYGRSHAMGLSALHPGPRLPSLAAPSHLAYASLNAWISDRTLSSSLASGKPAVVQHTGPSRFLPDAAGLFRFRDVEAAALCLETVGADYERQCRLRLAPWQRNTLTHRRSLDVC